jgi:transposase
MLSCCQLSCLIKYLVASYLQPQEYIVYHLFRFPHTTSLKHKVYMKSGLALIPHPSQLLRLPPYSPELPASH